MPANEQDDRGANLGERPDGAAPVEPTEAIEGETGDPAVLTDAPVATCCTAPNPSTIKPCALCQAPVCSRCRTYANTKAVCQTCAASIQAELAAEKAGVLHMPGAILGGFIAALVGAGAWAAITIITNLQIGYVAVGVGFLAGLGTFIGAGKKKGAPLQAVAAACAALGLIVGKYFIYAHFIVEYVNKKQPGRDLSILDLNSMVVLKECVLTLKEPMDLLFLALAFVAAIKVVRPQRVSMRSVGRR